MKKRGIKNKERTAIAEWAQGKIDEELLKPEAEIDADLIREYVELAHYYRNTAGEQKESFARKGIELLQRSHLAKAAAIGVLVIILFSAAATVAQISGVRVWSALVHWDKNYLWVDYSNTGDNDLPTESTRPNQTEVPLPTGEAAKYCEFSSDKELLDHFNGRLLYPKDADEIEFLSAYSHEDEISSDVVIRMTVGEAEITAEVSMYETPLNDDDLAITLGIGSDFHEVKTETFNGVKCIYFSNKNTNLVSFAYGYDIYAIYGNTDFEKLERITASMLTKK